MEAIQYLKMHYPGLNDFYYEMATEIGNINYFQNRNRQFVNVNYHPYIVSVGKTYHDLFIERAEEYLKKINHNQEIWKQSSNPAQF